MQLADVKATGRDRTVITKAGKRSFFSRVSEATLGSFPGHFWSVLGTKLGGVSAFQVVAMSSSSNRSNRRVLCLIAQTVV